MLSNKDKHVILEHAKKYRLSKVILFGSSLTNKKSSDIDLGIEGLKPELFFNFYGELLLKLSKNADVIDLSSENSFTKLIKKNGLKLYG